MSFLTRWEEDQSRPTVGDALKQLFVRAVLPAVLVFAVIVGFGFLLKGPLKAFSEWENTPSRALEEGRTKTGEAVTHIMSTVGNTEYVIGVCLLVVAVVWWRRRQWWYAVIPLIAISLQATVFVLATNVVDRPRPDVSRLDPAPPTSSYPSGHMGAATALYITFALMAASRLRSAVVRWVVVVLCVVAPLCVGYARLYRGAHHISDVVVGMLNGIVCALLAWGYLRRDPAAGGSQDEATLEAAPRASASG